MDHVVLAGFVGSRRQLVVRCKSGCFVASSDRIESFFANGFETALFSTVACGANECLADALFSRLVVGHKCLEMNGEIEILRSVNFGSLAMRGGRYCYEGRDVSSMESRISEKFVRNFID